MIMVKILVLGDTHIPRRSSALPEQFIHKIYELSAISKFDFVLFTGDIIEAPNLIKFLKSRATKGFYRVLGNMDFYSGNIDAPIYKKLQFNTSDDKNLVIGLTHGAQVEPRGDQFELEAFAHEKECNILISGHTHKEDVFLSENCVLLMNPGSATGAWSFLATETPSFIVINLTKNNQDINLSLFQLRKNEREMRETFFRFKFAKGKVLRAI